MMIITMMSMRLVMLMRLIRMMDRLHAAPKRSSAQAVVMSGGTGGEDHVLSVLDQARLEEGSYYY